MTKSRSETYLLFGMCNDYIEGGASDLIGAYASEAEAREALGEGVVDYDWAHILLVNGLKAKIVRRYNSRGWRNARW